MDPKELLDLLDGCRRRLAARGFNLWGVTRLADFDGAQCREGRLGRGPIDEVSVVVVGAGGGALWEHLAAGGKPPNGERHPIDGFSRRSLEAEAAVLREHGIPVCTIYPFDRRPVDFLKLAEAAGLGKVSPVVPFLLHPVYGPWVSLRGAFVLPLPLPVSGELEDFEPCATCACPCLDACPVDACRPPGGPDLLSCARHRHGGGCASGCEVRRACLIGREHRWSEAEETFRHRFSLATMRRWFGLGLWRFVPATVRRRV